MAHVIGSWLLLLALVLAPIIGGGFGGLTNGILQTLIFAGIGTNLLLNRKGGGVWARVPGLWFVCGFLVLSIAAAVHTRAVFSSISQLLFLLNCVGAYLLSATLCRDKKTAAAAVWALLLSALLVSAWGIRGYIIDSGGGIHFWRALMSSGDHQRLFGPFVNPSFFSGYLVIALPITLGVYLVTRRTLLVVLAGLGFVTDTLALMLTGAKFGIIAAVASLALFFLLAAATRSLRRSRFVRLLAISVLVLPLMMIFSAPVKSRIQAAESGGTQVHSTVFRVYTWRATANMIKAQPWLGFGPGTFPLTYTRYTIAGYTTHAHNSYLQLAAESGLPALLAFLLLILAIGRRSLLGVIGGSMRPADHAREVGDEPASDSITWSDLVPFSAWRLMNCALLAALAGSAIRSLVDSDWYVIGVSLPFWVVAGVLVSQSRGAEKDMPLSKGARWIAAAVCAIAIVFSVSFGLGDLFGSQAEAAAAANETNTTIDLYSRAASISPLNPEYHRQLAMWLALGDGDYGSADREIDTAIRLAAQTSDGGWYFRGMLQSSQGNWPAAISSLRTALKYSPKSTQVLEKLSEAYKASGDESGLDWTMHRIVDIENSPYEQIKGTPEIVDVTFAYAHAYFGKKLLARKSYSRAASEYIAAAERLERWRSSGIYRQVQQMMSRVDEEGRLELLRDCYRGLAAAYGGMGSKAEAAQVMAKADKVK